METSPLVRSKLSDVDVSVAVSRNISARAEQTSPCHPDWTRFQKHLRSCGANGHRQHTLISEIETSPLVRSKHTSYNFEATQERNISARAEQTAIPVNSFPAHQKHLRSCGANEQYRLSQSFQLETSPLVRSKPSGFFLLKKKPGNISARAEQTSPGPDICRGTEKHLRSCGANGSCPLYSPLSMETSPLVRSKPPVSTG